MDAHDKSTMANVVGWLALILSIIALVLAWNAFDRASDENLSEMIQNQVQDTVPNNQQIQPETNDDSLNDGAGTDVTPGVDDGVDGDATMQDDEIINP